MRARILYSRMMLGQIIGISSRVCLDSMDLSGQGDSETIQGSPHMLPRPCLCKDFTATHVRLPDTQLLRGALARVAIAQDASNASSVSPEILLLDEWLSVADHSFREKAQAHMHSLVEQSSILVLASHDLSLLEEVCNRGIYLKDGTIAHSGTIEEVITAYRDAD